MKKSGLLLGAALTAVLFCSCLNEEPFSDTVFDEGYLVNNGGSIENNVLSQNVTIRKSVTVKDLDLNGHTLTVACDGVTLDGVTNGNVVLEGAEKMTEIVSRSAVRAASGNSFGLIKEKSIKIKNCVLDKIDVKEQKWSLEPVGQVAVNVLNFFEAKGEIKPISGGAEAKLDINVLGIKKDAQGTVIGAGNIKATKFDTFETQVTVGDSVVNVTISNKIVISSNGVKIDAIVKISNSGKGQEVEESDGVVIEVDKDVDKSTITLPEDVDKESLGEVDSDELKETDLNESAICPDKTYSWVFNDLSLTTLDTTMDPQPGKEKLYKYETGTLYYVDVLEDYHYGSSPSGLDLIFAKGNFHGFAVQNNESKYLKNGQASSGVLLPGDNELTYVDIKGPFKVKMFYAAKTNAALNKHDIEGLYAYIRIGSNYFYDKYKESRIAPGDGSYVEAAYGGSDVVRVYFGSKSDSLNNRIGIWDIKVTQANPDSSSNSIECKMSEVVESLDAVDTYRFSEINLKITDNDGYSSVLNSSSPLVTKLKKISGVCVNLDLSECDNLTGIYSGAFNSLTCLSTVKMADTTDVMSAAFYGASNIKKIEVVEAPKDEANGIAAHISSVNGVLFNEDQSVLIAYPPLASATSYTVPSTVKTIGIQAFGCSENLTSVKLNEGLITVKRRAFQSCFNLASMEIPASLEVADGPFDGCSSLNLTVKSSSEFFKMVDGVLYSKDGTELVWYQQNKTDVDYTVPKEVQVLGKGAFYMSKLQCIYFESGSGITEFPEYTAGMAKSLMRIEVPDGVTYIGDYAFQSTSKLAAIWLPASIETIHYRAFAKDSELVKVFFKGTRAQLDAILPDLIVSKPSNVSQSDYENFVKFIRDAQYICSDETGYLEPPAKETAPTSSTHFVSWTFKTCPSGLESAFYAIGSSSDDKNYGLDKAVNLTPEFGTGSLKVCSFGTCSNNGIRWDENLHTINANRNEDVDAVTSSPDVTKNAARYVLKVTQPCKLEVKSVGAGSANANQRRVVLFSTKNEGTEADEQLDIMTDIDTCLEYKFTYDFATAGTYFIDCNGVRTFYIALKKPE